ncbi:MULTISPECIES: PDDEXK-like family protein [unclassified Salinicola]|uniref:PDDEXK-like family protein n=1 Tax=Salinicola sp. 4072 TaxID=3082157 RepID=UPI002FC860E0
MSSHDMLLQLASLLRQRYVRPPSFNLFTTLRGANDEVRLHSRFLAALLDPQAHGLGNTPMRELLALCEIRDFALEGLRVECERWHIDILVTNAQRQALLIENKIHAGDQEGQLLGYHQRLQEIGYRDIHVVYLSLDGRDPREDSLGELRHAKSGSYTALSYSADLVPWLESLLGCAALDPPLRESLAQYRQLILQLTGHNMDSDHLATLTETLLHGENLLSAHDIRLAYDEALIRLHAKLWRALRARIEELHPVMAEHIGDASLADEALDGYCRAYGERRRNSKHFGLFYRIPGYEDTVCAGIQVEDALYWGIYCYEPGDPSSHRALCEHLDEHGHSASRNVHWPSYTYGPLSLDFRSPSNDLLLQLADPARFESLVVTITDEVVRLWELCRVDCDATGRQIHS